jgi:hypothetical protein
MQINLSAVFLCGVASMIIGYLWYSKMLFGEAWMKLSGIRLSELDKDRIWKNYVFIFASSLVMAYVLAMLIKLMNTYSVLEGLKLGFWLWLGFVAAISFTNDLFNRVPMKLFLIKAGQHLASILVSSIILVWMG